MTKRSDIHRESALIPSEYEYVLSYHLATTYEGWPVPSFRVNCELDRRTEVDGKIVNGAHDPDGRCCIIGLLHWAKVKFAEYGTTGQCTACGAHFVYGDVWHHAPTGEHIHVGHICASKMELFVDRDEFFRAAGQHKQASLAALRRAEREEKADQFCAIHPGLVEALQRDHHTLADLKWKLLQYGDLSEKQVALAFKVARESDEREETKGNSEYVGTIGKRLEATVEVTAVPSWDSSYGTVYLYVMTDEAGNKLVWRTTSYPDLYRGDTARIRGTVKAHDEYDGEKQTVLTRVSVLDIVKPSESRAA